MCVISQDLLKTPTRVRERVMASLAAQQPFVVEKHENALRGQRAELIAAVKAASFRVIGYYFPCERRDAIRRSLQRAEGEESMKLLMKPARSLSTRQEKCDSPH